MLPAKGVPNSPYLARNFPRPRTKIALWECDMKLLQGFLLGSAATLAGSGLPAAPAAELSMRQSTPIEYVRVCNAHGDGFFALPGIDSCLGISRLAGVGTPGDHPAIGSRGSLSYGFNTAASSNSQPPTTIGNKAFIQFARLTAGYAPRIFDFSADAGSSEGSRGTATAGALLAYVATFGKGFSMVLSAEDQVSRPTTIAGVVPSVANSSAGASPEGAPSDQLPDGTANPRLDQQAWDAAQLTRTTQQGRGDLLGLGAPPAPQATVTSFAPAYAFLALTGNPYAFAIQGGIQLNADYLPPGDKLWLEAAYEKGAIGSIAGNNFVSDYGADQQSRSGFASLDYGVGGNQQASSDCVFKSNGSCEQPWAWDIAGANKHYWLPTLSSGIYGSYMEVHYPGDALAGIGGPVGISNPKDGRVGTNLGWMPLRGFDIGAEFMYVHLNQAQPAGRAPDAPLNAGGSPPLPSNTNQSEAEGRLRLPHAF